MAVIDYDAYNRSRAGNGQELLVGEGTMSRNDISSAGIVTATQSLRLSFFTAKKSEMVSQVRMICGSTAAAATPTLIRIGVYQVDDITGDLTLIASTPNDTSLFAATSTAYTKALSAPFYKVKGTRYAVGILIVTAVATPTLLGISVITPSEAAVAPRMNGYSSPQNDLPATLTDASLAQGATNPYAVLLP